MNEDTNNMDAFKSFKAQVAERVAEIGREATFHESLTSQTFWLTLDALNEEAAQDESEESEEGYLVWFHARQSDERIDLPLTGEPAGFVEAHPIYGDLFAFRYRVPDAELQQFLDACERLDAVALYTAVNTEITQERLDHIADRAGHTRPQVELLLHLSAIPFWRLQATDAEVVDWVRSFYLSCED